MNSLSEEKEDNMCSSSIHSSNNPTRARTLSTLSPSDLPPPPPPPLQTMGAHGHGKKETESIWFEVQTRPRSHAVYLPKPGLNEAISFLKQVIPLRITLKNTEQALNQALTNQPEYVKNPKSLKMLMENLFSNDEKDQPQVERLINFYTQATQEELKTFFSSYTHLLKYKDFIHDFIEYLCGVVNKPKNEYKISEKINSNEKEQLKEILLKGIVTENNGDLIHKFLSHLSFLIEADNLEKFIFILNVFKKSTRKVQYQITNDLKIYITVQCDNNVNKALYKNTKNIQNSDNIPRLVVRNENIIYLIYPEFFFHSKEKNEEWRENQKSKTIDYFENLKLTIGQIEEIYSKVIVIQNIMSGEYLSMDEAENIIKQQSRYLMQTGIHLDMAKEIIKNLFIAASSVGNRASTGVKKIDVVKLVLTQTTLNIIECLKRKKETLSGMKKY